MVQPMAQPVVTHSERRDDRRGQAAQGVGQALARGCHRHVPMVACREAIRPPDHGRPPPTAAPVLPMAGERPVQALRPAHRDHLPKEQSHIVDPRGKNHPSALPTALLDLCRSWHAHGTRKCSFWTFCTANGERYVVNATVCVEPPGPPKVRR